jgi:hypothetical protein
MHNLKEIQDSLLSNIINRQKPSEFIKQQGGIDVAERLEIHRDTVFENFVSALKISYPCVWRLIGDDCARGVALAYSHDINHLKSRDSINLFGEDFPEFLKNFESTKRLYYLSDFAKLEWLRTKSYESTRETFLSVQDMESFFMEGDENGKLEFNSSVFFLESKFPLMNIQELLENSEIQELVMDDSMSFIVVCRLQGKIETLYLSQNQWQFLYNLSNGNAIGKAMECFVEEEVEAELSSIIQLLLSKQMIKRVLK